MRAFSSYSWRTSAAIIALSLINASYALVVMLSWTLTAAMMQNNNIQLALVQAVQRSA